IRVTQGGKPYALPGRIELDSAANSCDTLQIYSPGEWTLSESADWFSVTPAAGTQSAKVVVKALTNNSDTAARRSLIVLSSNIAGTDTLEVLQQGSRYYLALSTTTLTLGPEANNTATFAVSSNTQWALSSPQSWLSVAPLTGTGNAIITVKTNETMTLSRPRVITLTLSSNRVKQQPKIKITQQGIPCTESDEAYCETLGCSPILLPAYGELTSNPYLPDPFTFLDGSKVSTKADWTCRRVEIAALAQKFEFGNKPCTPYSATTASFNSSNNTLTVTVTENGKTISFDCIIIYPSTGSAPYPAMIGIGYSFLNNTELSNMGVAIINFPSDQIAEQQSTGSRGKGKFYDLYCSNHSAGALMAWAWGVSRLIDALEKTPEANIDPNRLGVTGCSRYGKGALVAGAFDERIKLTIPQESGSGGAASWRVSDAQKADGQNVQTLSQIVTENCWFRNDFGQFSNTANKLPFDHHLIMALCAPRALLVIENTSMEWLGNLSTWTTANAAHYVWEALEIPDYMGFSQVGHADHCGFPTAQIPELQAYVKKFLVGNGSDNTHLMKTDGNFTFDKDRWVNWTVPDLP
ncbi:MAG: BACON domain-containing protein, partial [Bacteroidales bacterium]